MVKEMIVSANDRETAVAILEDDQVVEVFVEREKQQGVVGNIYKGRVSKVLPGMQSAFVDLGLERDGFLYVSDVLPPEEALDDDADDDGAAATPPAALAPVAVGDAVETAETVGEVLDTAPPAAPADTPRPDRRQRLDRAAQPNIEDLLKEGQDVLVQVAKEPIGTKGARITSHITIPGRFLVFMPTVDHVGVSRKIESRDERARLRGIVRQFRESHGFTGGVIIRTAAASRADADIIGDLEYFHQTWQEMQQKASAQRAPSTVYR